jgi:hypothetical protein
MILFMEVSSDGSRGVSGAAAATAGESNAGGIALALTWINGAAAR